MPEVSVPIEKSEAPGFSFSHPKHMLRVLKAYCEDSRLPWVVLQNQIEQLVNALYKDGWALSKIRGDNLSKAHQIFKQNKNIDVFVNLKPSNNESFVQKNSSSASGPEPTVS